MDGSIGFSTTQSVGNYPESSFIFQNKFKFWGGTLRNFFPPKMELYDLKKHTKKAKWGYLGIILDTSFIILQNEPSPILVGPKLGES